MYNIWYNKIKYRPLFDFIYKVLRPYYLALIGIISLSILWAVDFSLRPYLLKVILNLVSDNTNDQIFEYLAWPVSIYLFMMFLSSTSARVYSYLFEIRIMPFLKADIIRISFKTLLKKNISYYQNNFTGSIASMVTELSNCIPDFIQIIVDRFFRHSLAIVIATYTICQVSSTFAVIMLMWIAIFISVSLLFMNKTAKLTREWSNLFSKVNGQLADIILNMVTVQLFTQQKLEKLTLDKILHTTTITEQKLSWLYFWICFIYGYSFVIVQGINLYFLISYRQLGILSVGDFALVLTINVSMVGFLQDIMNDFSHFSRLLGRITQALQVINFQNSLESKVKTREYMNSVRGQVIFDNVSFHYPNNDLLFKNKSIVINAGEKVGLVGYSGSGKTTFINLILRLFEISEGNILIDNQNISQIDLNSLRENIVIIPQEPILFNRSLMENIRYGKPTATDEEVIAAARVANADEFIREMPGGYYFTVGERGTKLSGGQRQMIAIARAILKDAPILILDEPTSQLDAIIESRIQNSLECFMQGRTTIVIAHRLSTLIHLDKILVFERGMIVQEGTHERLVKEPGLYRRMCESQSISTAIRKGLSS